MPFEYCNIFNVLIIDNDETYIEKLLTFFQKINNIYVFIARNKENAMKIINDKEIDLILFDLIMTEIDGFELCLKLKQDKETKNIPIIFLTEENNIDNITKAFNIGCSDYINKLFNEQEFKARIFTQLKFHLLLQELTLKQNQLAYLSTIDPLTKLNNSIYLNSKIKHAIKNNINFWIVHIQIEHLEKIYNTSGYSKAENILRDSAQILKEVLNNSEIVARLYGAHFGVMVPDLERKELESLLTKLVNRINLLHNVHSIVVANKVYQSDNLSSLLNRCDITLKEQKKLDTLPYLIKE